MSQLTIRDIARQAGVSVATVSRVINGTGNVNEAMKTQVQAVIHENEYRPNSSARGLKGKKTFAIGLILSDISDRYYSLMTKTIADVLPAREYSLIVCTTDNLPEKERWYFDFLSDRQVDGIILNTVGGLDKEIYALSHHIPIVLVNRRVEELPDPQAKLDFVGSDDLEGAASMTRLLLEKGHRKIAIVNGEIAVSSGLNRFLGFQQAMEEAGIPVDAHYPYRFDGKFDTDTGYLGMHKLFSSGDVPTAVLTMNDSITIGALKYCRENGVAIPDEVSLVAYGEVDNADLFTVSPTCMMFSPNNIGRRAAQCLFERISQPARPNREIVFASALVSGNSVKALGE